jgi:hypothetical protein
MLARKLSVILALLVMVWGCTFNKDARLEDPDYYINTTLFTDFGASVVKHRVLAGSLITSHTKNPDLYESAIKGFPGGLIVASEDDAKIFSLPFLGSKSVIYSYIDKTNGAEIREKFYWDVLDIKTFNEATPYDAPEAFTSIFKIDAIQLSWKNPELPSLNRIEIYEGDLREETHTLIYSGLNEHLSVIGFDINESYTFFLKAVYDNGSESPTQFERIRSDVHQYVVTDFSVASSNILETTLSWTNPEHAELTRIAITRQTSLENFDTAEILYDGDVISSFRDISLSEPGTYYYGIYLVFGGTFLDPVFYKISL